jgi:diadenosine tetraphosphatase ApaH/serine/threonine PP2A family protein phosphatase
MPTIVISVEPLAGRGHDFQTMRIAAITDIHGNLPALEAVLSDIEKAEIERIWCLGDTVGYGAFPNECVNLVRERCEVSLVGNHDLAVTGEIDTGLFSPSAAEAVKWTQGEIGKEALEFLTGLQPETTLDEASLYHASPRDPVWEYVLGGEQAEACLEVQARPISLIGHSHVALFFSNTSGESADLDGGQCPEGTEHGVDEGRWLLNPGSAGQPRDNDPKAAWLELDLSDAGRVARWRRCEYDIDRAAQAIRDAGLPAMLAERLYSGQ